jgi:two-component system sensor histidine kinase AtoS
MTVDAPASVRLQPNTTAAARSTRAKLLVLLPLTMALLVAGAAFFTLSIATRTYELHGTGAAASHDIAQLGLQIAGISLIAAVLGFGIALGVTRPVRQMVEQLEALASGDLRGKLAIASTSELDSLGGAVNDAISAIQRYYLQSMTGAVITLDADGRVIGSSAAAEATLGYREEALVGRRFSDVFTPTSRSRASLTAVETAIADRKPVSIDDVEILVADGRPVRIGITASYLQQRTASTLREPQGRPEPGRGTTSSGQVDEVVGVTIAFKDLNEMRSLRARLQQAEQLAALGTVTAGVAHEIRNPLASLRGLTELLGRDVQPADPRRMYVETMLESIDRLNRLIEDLLLFSRPKADDVSQIDLGQVVSETVSMARHGLGDRRVRLLLALNPTERLVVRGNRQRVGQVLTNIILNGVQATPDDGEVTVSATERDGQAHVSVHNTGSFIPAEIRRQLFVPFFTTKPAGTGLGLAIARQIVTGLDGRIDIASDPATGTTFTIELPLVVREAALA